MDQAIVTKNVFGSQKMRLKGECLSGKDVEKDLREQCEEMGIKGK
jgi:hypothetical protein